MTAKKKNKIRVRVQRVKDEWATFKGERPTLSSRNIGIAFLVTLLLVVFPLIIWQVPKVQLDHFEELPLEVEGVQKNNFEKQKQIFEMENKARQTLVQIIGGILLLLGLYTALRRVKATEAQVRAIEEGQVTERYTRAIDQLGKKDSMEVRLGGIYALDRIGKDSPKDRLQIIEVLTAYIRNNAGKEDVSASEEDDNKEKKSSQIVH